jgi:hypothetical protein
MFQSIGGSGCNEGSSEIEIDPSFILGLCVFWMKIFSDATRL